MPGTNIEAVIKVQSFMPSPRERSNRPESIRDKGCPCMLKQDDFDQLIKNYNDDYCYLLIRASQRSYECLISSFMMLKDLYQAIISFQASEKYLFRIPPYPLSIRANDDLLRTLGFDEEGIRNIYGFLAFVKETQGKEFEECLEGSVYHLCKRHPDDQSWQIKATS
jgi:hypothetical protein